MKSSKRMTKTLAMILCAVMLLQYIPLTARAETAEEYVYTYQTVESTLAPGVTQSVNSGYGADGALINYYIAVADINRDDVGVQASYKDAQCETTGMSPLLTQVAAMTQKHTNSDDTGNYIPYYAIVAGVNGDGYNTSTGKPSGVHIMNGVVGFGTTKTGNTPWFAIFEDGTALCGSDNTDWDAAVAAHGNAVEAIGGFQLVRKDGVDYAPGSTEAKSSYLNDSRYPRSFVGVTADNKVVIMTVDGSGSGGSAGANYAESLELMDEAGCVYILCLDGGGSATYVSRPEGGSEVEVTNSPSDGSPRAVSNGLVIYTTTPPSDVFERANLTAEHSYVTPGSRVSIAAIGVSPAGTEAEIPAEAAIKVDETYGTIEDGTFVSNGTAAEVKIWMEYNGNVVGETTIYVVAPEKIEFSKTTISVPYEKTEQLEIVATYGLNKVVLNDEDIVFTLSDQAAGTIEGNNFTACAADAGLTGATIIATYTKDDSITCTANLNFGKASVVVADFEDKDLAGFAISVANQGKQGYDMYMVTGETGKVHSGDGAVAVELDFRNISDPTPAAGSYTGNNFMSKTIPVDGQADKFGMWIYIPEIEEMTAITARFYIKGVQTSRYAVKNIFLEGDCTSWENDGWRYFEVDISSLGENSTLMCALQIWITEAPSNENNGYSIYDYKSHNSKITLYIDDVTVDYSSVVADRENPAFKYATVAYEGLSDAVILNGQTVSKNVVTVAAMAADDMTKDNATGIDPTSASAYVDGVEIGVDCSADGLLVAEQVALADGTHTFRFEICDKQGNLAYIERQLTVAADSDMPTVAIVPAEADADNLPIGSVYWMNIETSNIEKVQSVTTELNLNSVNTWELDHIETAYGFVASYTVDKATNNARVTITRTGENTQTGEAVLAKLPIRTWESTLAQKDPTYTPEYMWTKNIVWPIDIKLESDLGVVSCVDGTIGTFSMAPLAVNTELYGFAAELKEAGKTGWHQHTVQSADDKAATCTENGYTGRTWCATCASPVEWGTTLNATGHSFAITDGVLKCDCGQTYTGTWTDGKEYIDGVAIADGWNGDVYYKDGVMLTGIQIIDGYYYDFGEDGVCKNRAKLNGLFYDETVSAYRYAKLGEPQGGWVKIGDYWHYFDTTTKVAVTGDYYYSARGITYHFDETGKTEGVWQVTKNGTRFWYGQWYYQATGTYRRYFVEIDGKIYNFDSNGYLTTGIHALYDDWAYERRGEMNVWEFDENGVLVGQITGKGLIDNKRGGMYLIEEDGFVHGGNAHLAKYNDDIYFVVHSGKLKQDATQSITDDNSNGLLAAGTYYFGEDCKLFTGIKANDEGVLYYWENGQIGTGLYNSELVEIDGDIYLVKWSGKVAMNETREVPAAKSNGLQAGEYEFGADGKGIYMGDFSGVRTASDGILYYYVNGEICKRTYNSELVEINGEIYLVKWSGKVAFNETRVIPANKANSLLSAGTYYFGADGKLFTGIKEESDGLLYYYCNGKLVNRTYNSEVVELNGEIYLVKWSGKVAFNETRLIPADKTNGLLTAGTYYFGADGTLFTGVMEGNDGILYYYEDGQLGNRKYNSELVEIDGAIYLVKWSGKVAMNETRLVPAAKTNGLIAEGTYTFGADGKLVK